MNKIKEIFLCFVLVCATVLTTAAQDGEYTGYTPYSVFGIGDLYSPGSAYNKSMGGVGVATRNRRYLNYLNPASVTCRDSLSFMADFSLSQSNSLYRSGEVKSGKNVFNLNNLALSFPIYRSSAMMLGITPYSSTGYGYSANTYPDELIGQTGTIQEQSAGKGGIYQVFWAGAVTFWKKLSLGVEGIYYFGNMEKDTNVSFSEESYNGISTGYDVKVTGTTGKFGVQYEQPVGKLTLGIGATYKMSARMKGFITDYKLATGSILTDTLRYNIDTLKYQNARFANEFAVGVSLRSGEKWRAEVNYERAGWDKSGIGGVEGLATRSAAQFSTTASSSIRAGFEIIPNQNDIRYYYKRCTYRAGIHYDKAYYKLDGNNVNTLGITFGGTLPVFNMYNGISIAIDVGQRASLTGSMVRERYINFCVGFNAFDIWFVKPRYN